MRCCLFLSRSLSSFQTTPTPGPNPNPKAFVCVLAFLLSLSVDPFIYSSAVLFSDLFFPLSYNLFTVSLSLSAVLITLAVPPVRLTLLACLCLLAEMTISVFNTGNKQTIATTGVTQLALRFFSPNSLSLPLIKHVLSDHHLYKSPSSAQDSSGF